MFKLDFIENFHNTQKKYFQVFTLKLLYFNICAIIFLVPFGLITGLYKPLYSNILKHIAWGAFLYSLFFILILVVLKHKDKSEQNNIPIIKRVLSLTFLIVILLNLFTEVEKTFDINYINLCKQLPEILLDTMGTYIIYFLNIFLLIKNKIY